MTETKFCRTCDAETERNKDGRCMPCHRAADDRYYRRKKGEDVPLLVVRHDEPVPPGMNRQQCRNPEKYRKYQREYQRQWAEQNREKKNATARASRARLKANPPPPEGPSP